MLSYFWFPCLSILLSKISVFSYVISSTCESDGCNWLASLFFFFNLFSNCGMKCTKIHWPCDIQRPLCSRFCMLCLLLEPLLVQTNRWGSPVECERYNFEEVFSMNYVTEFHSHLISNLVITGIIRWVILQMAVKFLDICALVIYSRWYM